MPWYYDVETGKSSRFGEWTEHFRPSKRAFPEQAAVLTQLQSHYWPPQMFGLHGTCLLPCDNHMWRVDLLRSYWRWTHFLFLLLFSRSLQICRIASKLLQILLLWQQSVTSQAYHSLFISSPYTLPQPSHSQAAEALSVNSGLRCGPGRDIFGHESW